mmetsp:Transcript_70417/g.195991  ORF Transcript_70417/g.195991 Transcript_70417/m.195991 type:complete len:260 (-) Transcript_70417:57-836(-)
MSADPQDEVTLKCSIIPEAPSWAYRCGVFFDVYNKTDRPIVVTALTAGAHNAKQPSKLYACTAGASTDQECNPALWTQVWHGDIEVRTSTPLRLDEPVNVEPRAEQGFLLVSEGYALYHTTSPRAVEDENIEIRAGLRSTEHRGDQDPFAAGAHSRHDAKSTHAGSVSYRFAEVLAVTLSCSDADSVGVVSITCMNCSAAELCTVDAQSDWNALQLRRLLADTLGMPWYSLKLLRADGTPLGDEDLLSTMLLADDRSVA